MPAEAEAAARDSVAVTCGVWTSHPETNPISNYKEANQYRIKEDLLCHQSICIQYSKYKTPNDL
ncbi:DNA-polymerase III subunit beta [Sesbania bispinosa]|nr:DNA-polymerase III subunit beta [Sesbania bispinosa]